MCKNLLAPHFTAELLNVSRVALYRLWLLTCLEARSSMLISLMIESVLLLGNSFIVPKQNDRRGSN